MSCGCAPNGFIARARNKVAVEQVVATDDGLGGRNEDWSLVRNAWAIIEPKSGREMWVNSQLQSRVDAIITIRYISAISDTRDAAKCRVKFGTRLYNVRAIRNVAGDLKTEGKVFQQLVCVEGEPT